MSMWTSGFSPEERGAGGIIDPGALADAGLATTESCLLEAGGKEAVIISSKLHKSYFIHIIRIYQVVFDILCIPSV